MSALAMTVSDTLVLAQRNLMRIPRQPDLLVAYTIQPVMFTLLFVYVFGGAIQTPGYDGYADFMIPGIIPQAVRRLDDADVGIADITLRRPTLDDVFIALTGHAAEEEEVAPV